MIEAIILGLVLSLGFGILVSLASNKWKVKSNPIADKIYDVLPHQDCGGCGFPNCRGFADAVSKDHSKAGGCVVGGKDTAKKISVAIGENVTSKVSLKAFVACSGGSNIRNDYNGIKSCASASLVSSYISCEKGCLGFGDCVNVCPTGAISIKDGVALVDTVKCIGCGKCVKACPKNIIRLTVPGKVLVRCSEEGMKKAKYCSNGCLGCGICANACEGIVMKDSLPKISGDPGECIDKCPRNVLIKI